MNRNPYIFKIARNDVVTLFFVFLTVPYLQPVYLERFIFINRLLDIWKVLSFIIILFVIFNKVKHVTWIAAMICISRIYLVIVTLVQAGDVYACLRDSFLIISITLLYDFAIKMDKNAFLKSQFYCLSIVILINFITILLYPYGMENSAALVNSRVWFLGFYNSYTQYFIPALLFGYLLRLTTERRIIIYVMTAVMYMSTFRIWAAGSVLSLAIMGIVYLFLKHENIVLNYYSYWIIQVVFYFVVVVKKSYQYFLWLIDGVLGRYVSLLSRIYVWDVTRGMIRQHIWFGHGVRADAVRIQEYGIATWARYAHNLLLEILYQGGLFYLGLYVLIIILAGKNMRYVQRKEISRIISIAFLGWTIQSFSDAYMSTFLVGMFIVAFHCLEFDSSYWEKKYGKV